jgi:hypothetical protein
VRSLAPVKGQHDRAPSKREATTGHRRTANAGRLAEEEDSDGTLVVRRRINGAHPIDVFESAVRGVISAVGR